MTDKAYVYSARSSYDDPTVASTYERVRFTSLLGRYRRQREIRAVRAVLGRLPDRPLSILDCPCGIGRWWPLLARRASSITAMDIAPAMMERAALRVPRTRVPVTLVQGDAERLPLEDGAVDVTFSFALTKHLPRPVQYQVLREFSRVSRIAVVCTFGVMNHVTYEFWRRRGFRESYPLFPEELQWMAQAAGLRVAATRPCTTPIGVEHVVLFEKA